MDKTTVEQVKESISNAEQVLGNNTQSKVNKEWLKQETDKFDLMRAQFRVLINDYPQRNAEDRLHIKNTLTIWLGYYDEVIAETRKAIESLED
tara:strand:+ start:633 stop:911 length:279 start_codon:yes stop_codon:yes gene_type:complete